MGPETEKELPRTLSTWCATDHVSNRVNSRKWKFLPNLMEINSE